jgi:FkbM family methyltransferase
MTVAGLTVRSTGEQEELAVVIYDFGMNNGDDVEYYLTKAELVVGVEANSALCNQVCRRYEPEVRSGRLTVLNAALSETDKPLTFYIHKTNHVLSQLPPPDATVIDQFDAVTVPCRTPASIVREFGEPLYIKVDVEHYDAAVLRNLFAAGIFPPEISAEAHTVDVFALMVVNGYKSFALVDGSSVAEKYGFRPHSAGPFGPDIGGPWYDPEAFFYLLASEGLGWKDIHAMKGPGEQLRRRDLILRQARGLARNVRGAVRARLGAIG